MHIYCNNHHEALVIDDQADTVTISPAVNGILTVGGNDYAISNGESVPTVAPANISKTRAVFTTTDGIRYTVIAPRVDKGVLTSRPDPYAYCIDLRLLVDNLEKELEQTRKELRQHRGKEERQALNFMKNKKEA